MIIPSCDWLIGGGGGDNWMVTLFIEGEAVADAKGIKKNIKYTVAEAAMEYLRCSVVGLIGAIIIMDLTGRCPTWLC